MLNQSQLYYGWTAGVCWKKYLYSTNSLTKIQELSDKFPTDLPKNKKRQETKQESKLLKQGGRNKKKLTF